MTGAGAHVAPPAGITRATSRWLLECATSTQRSPAALAYLHPGLSGAASGRPGPGACLCRRHAPRHRRHAQATCGLKSYATPAAAGTCPLLRAQRVTASSTFSGSPKPEARKRPSPAFPHLSGPTYHHGREMRSQRTLRVHVQRGAHRPRCPRVSCPPWHVVYVYDTPRLLGLNTTGTYTYT